MTSIASTTPSEETNYLNDLKKAFKTGCSFLLIYSRHQDIGIKKCELGVKKGYLKKKEIEIDDQETHWRYYWTKKAKEEWSD